MLICVKLDASSNKAFVDDAFDWAALVDQPVVAADTVPAGYADASGPRAWLTFGAPLGFTPAEIQREMSVFSASWATLAADDRKALVERGIIPTAATDAELDALYTAGTRDGFRRHTEAALPPAAGAVATDVLRNRVRALGGRVLWSPTEAEEKTAGLVCGYTSDALVAAGALAEWPGTPSTRPATVDGQSKAPTVVLDQANGYPVVRFNKTTSQYYRIRNALAATKGVGKITAIFVIKANANSTSSDRVLQINNGTNTRFQVRINTTTNLLLCGGRRVAADAFSSEADTVAVSQTAFTLYVCECDWSVAAPTVKIWRNGVLAASDTLTGQAQGVTDAVDSSLDPSIGAQSDGLSDFLSADLPVLRLYVGLSATDREKREGELRWKYGTPALPSTHPYSVEPPLERRPATLYRPPVVLAVSGGAIVHTGTTAETDLATIAVPAGALGKNGFVRVTTLWTFSGGANTKTARTKYGGTKLGELIHGATNLTSSRQDHIQNRNSESAQIGLARVSSSWGPTGAAAYTGAVDSAVGQNIAITMALADAADSATLEMYMVEVFYAA